MSPGTAKKGGGFQTESGDPSPPHVPLVSSCKFVGPAGPEGPKSPSREQGRPCFKGGSRGGSRAPLEERVGGRAGGVLSSHFLQASEEPTGPTWSPASARALPWKRLGRRRLAGAGREAVPRGRESGRQAAGREPCAGWPGPDTALLQGGCVVARAGACHSSLRSSRVGLGHSPVCEAGRGGPPGAGSFSFCSAVRGGFGFTHRSPGCCQLLPTVSV